MLNALPGGYLQLSHERSGAGRFRGVTLLAALREHRTDLLFEEVDTVLTECLGDCEHAETNQEWDHATTLRSYSKPYVGWSHEIHSARYRGADQVLTAHGKN